MVEIIDFEAKREEREQEKRYEYIHSMVQIGEPELFDKLIAEQVLTDERIASCSDFIELLRKRGHDPLSVFEEATFMTEDCFFEENGVNWFIAIEEALTYYAFMRKYEKTIYEEALRLHPYISAFE